MLVGLVAAGHSHAEILNAYPYLEEEDIRQALAYAAWRVEEIEVPLAVARRPFCIRESRMASFRAFPTFPTEHCVLFDPAR
jgi:hypothetical protein